MRLPVCLFLVLLLVREALCFLAPRPAHRISTRIGLKRPLQSSYRHSVDDNIGLDDDTPHSVDDSFGLDDTPYDEERPMSGAVDVKTIQHAAAISCLSAAMVLLFHPSSALAIDHPIDYFHLSLPNPIPDADPRYFLSGGLCAAASHGITTPIDVVKTKIQSNPAAYGDLGVAGAAQKIIHDEGIATLLTGQGPTIVGYGLEGAAKFGLYEALKPEMSRLLHTSTPAISYLIASVTAGAVAALMLCPMEKTRIRLVTDPDFADYNLLTGIPRLVEENGVGSLFGGLGAMLSKQVPYTFAKQVSFDAFAAFLYTLAASVSLAAKDVKLEVSFAAALLASILACVLSHPGDVILTKTYKPSDGADPAFADVVADVYEDEGLPGFFSGLSARFLHVGAIITSQLVLYDTIKQLLGLPATGT